MYQNALIDGINAATMLSANVFDNLVKKTGGSTPSLMGGVGGVANISNSETIAVVLFNPLGWSRAEIVILPVNRADLTVYDSNQMKLTSQISPAVGGNITSKYHLFFTVTVSGLGYATYFIEAPASDFIEVPNKPVKIVEDTMVQNSIIAINISSATNLIGSITNLKSGLTLSVAQTLQQYTSLHSGAYAFGPAGPSFPIASPTTTISRGPIADEITTKFNNWAKQTIRVYHAGGNSDVEQFAEIWFDIGPLPSRTEVITLFTSEINSNGIITTDDNGFEFLDREYQWGSGIESNYYPLIYASYISDLTSQLSVISYRSHGTSSQTDGALEVMIHRNPDMGDGFGPGLTDTTEVYPVLRVIVDTPSQSPKSVRRQSYLLNFPLAVFTSPTTSPSSWINSYKTTSSLLTADLPPNVHLLSVNALDETSTKAIIRLTNIFAINEDPSFSKPVTLDLTKVFSSVSVSSIMETTLSANKNIGPVSTITLDPHDIRTFVFTFSK
jgi:hypothetical protein